MKSRRFAAMHSKKRSLFLNSEQVLKVLEAQRGFIGEQVRVNLVCGFEALYKNK